VLKTLSAFDIATTLGKLRRFPSGDGVPHFYLENTMSQEKTHRPRARRPGVHLEEEKAWIGFYRRVGNPDIATEVMHQLESDPEMKRTYLALYLRCKETLRTQKARQARHKRIGQFIRMLFHGLIVAPAIAAQKLLRQSGEIAVECLPEVRKEPAVRQVKNLARDTEFGQAQSEFDSQAAHAVKASSPASKAGNAG
jgi:hypothetical protein